MIKKFITSLSIIPSRKTTTTQQSLSNSSIIINNAELTLHTIHAIHQQTESEHRKKNVNKNQNRISFGKNSPPLPPSPLRPPRLELGDGAPALSSEQQHRTSISRGQPPQLLDQALIVRIPLGAAFPRQIVDLLLRLLDPKTLLRLQLDIELRGLLQPLAPRVPAAAAAGAAAELGGGEGSEGEEEEEGEEGEVEGGEEEGEGDGEVGEDGGDEEEGGEEDEEEDEEI